MNRKQKRKPDRLYFLLKISGASLEWIFEYALYLMLAHFIIYAADNGNGKL